MTLAGIIYLHRITDNRMAGTPLKNLRMFANLCGDDAIGNVILASTMWRQGKEAIEERREAELKSKYWKGMIDQGSEVVRFHRTFDSAWTIVDIIDRKRDTRHSLLLQEEMVNLSMQLSETQVGKQLYNTLQKLLAEQQEAVRRLRDEASTQNNPQLVEDLNAQYNEIQENLRSTFNQIKEIKIPLGRRIAAFFRFKSTHAVSLSLIFRYQS